MIISTVFQGGVGMGRQLIRNSTAEFLIFTSQAGEQSIEARFEEGTLWLSQKLMAELFDVSVPNISMHLKAVFESGELRPDSVVKKYLTTGPDGKRYNTQHYNLDAIISVGYRVNSIRATQFRQWATRVLHQFAIRGYVLDRKRLENGAFLGEDYFERLLEEIREIRLSERRLYQKVTDIYATAVDYNPQAPTSRQFFSSVQNKLHYAVHRHTAAEIIHDRADADQPHMGLTTWEKAPTGKVIRTDVVVGKNYLTKTELEDLGRLVSSFLDLAERRARRHQPTTMEDWARLLDRFLAVDESPVLESAGSVSMKDAQHHALSEFERFRVVQDQLHVSDFDKLVSSMKNAEDAPITSAD
jgi:hypothetical protein